MWPDLHNSPKHTIQWNKFELKNIRIYVNY